MTAPGGEDSRSDEQLIAALNAGDRSAFDGLYHRHRDWVVRLARRVTGRDDEALDVLQETFAYFFAKFPGFVLTARLTTFFYPVVRNLAIAKRGKRRRERELTPAIDPTSPAAPPDDRDELEALLRRLPPAQREVLLMRFVDGMTLLEIAQALAIPTGTVKSRMHAAVGALKADPRVRRYWE